VKNRLFAIGLIIFFPVAGTILSGCNSQGTSFTLEAPGCTATWDDDITWVAWSKVDGADYYVIYGKKYNKDTESPPHNPRDKDFEPIATNLTKSPYKHITRDDYSYVVKAFKNNKESSDFSNIAFTW